MSKLSLAVEKAVARGDVVNLGPLGRYIELDRAVDKAEGDGIVARWEFGREVLAERVGKKLPVGRLDEIAKAIGKSRQEVGYRALFATRYPTREELANAIGKYGSWFAIVNDALANKELKDREARQISEGGADTDAGAWQMLAGDFRDRLAEFPPDTVDLILTDPPYPEEFALLWSDLAEHAARALRPGGIVAALTGKIHLADRMRRLGDHLDYGWVYAQPLPGSNTRILARHTLQEWKPWVCYVKGAWPSGQIEWHGDLLTAGPRDKTDYHWQQQLEPAVQLIERLTLPGALVVDPFAGSGTYGVAAVQSGRRFIGIELDAKRLAVASERIGQAAQ